MLRRSAFRWPDASKIPNAPTNKGLVIHYDGANRGLPNAAHTECISYWKWCRDFHMKKRGWRDIGYSYGVCPHGIIMEGRGYRKEQAAQPGGNRDWCSVTLMIGPDEYPTKKQINGVRLLRKSLMKLGMGSYVSYHNKFYSTNCPGTVIKDMVLSRVFSKEPEMTDEDKYEEAIDQLPLIKNLEAEAKTLIRNFQRKHKLTDDGVIGTKTWSKLLESMK